ncbi:hypothetical protein IE53DRAFT_339840 [Violaceomyces palustris]|uniref:Uncharacterized protein n=1 Tax=Violaceomyces palustris TaxID=1673888 RepID=A0ACD0P407_9BASI|nr:hypothetical protein IE53DRAFT_339840 [Violaceomyces palustris]
MSAWKRGTEAPMDTSPPGPRKRSIFECQSPELLHPTADLAPNPHHPHLSPSAPFLFHCHPSTAEALVDVEMASLTPPSNRIDSNPLLPHSNEEPKHHPPKDSLLDVSFENQSTPTKSQNMDPPHQASSKEDVNQRKINSSAVSRVRRSRSLKSTQPATRTRKGGAALSKLADPLDDQDQESDSSDQDDGQERSSITKYAINYFIPQAMQQHGGNGKSADPGRSAGVDHLDWPELLLGYAQFIFNASILVAFLYLLYGVVRTVQQDVAEKVREYEIDILRDITACAKSYADNRCGTSLQAPALAAACQGWERCSARDPAVVGRARVTAETFADILNGFVDAVSWKSMVFTLLTLAIGVRATNSTLSFFRVRSRRHHQSDHRADGQRNFQSGHSGVPPQIYPNYAMPYIYPHHGWDSINAPPATPARKRFARSKDVIDEDGHEKPTMEPREVKDSKASRWF